MMFFIRYILPVIAVGLLIWGAVTWRNNDIAHWKGVGRAELTAELEKAQAEADEKTRQEQAKIQRKTREVEHEVRKAQGADAPASPYLRGVLDRMRAAD